MITNAYTKLTALLAHATPRPWNAEINGPFSRVTPMYGDLSLCNLDEQDALLIAAAVNALPSLLSDLEASQKREQVLREAGRRLLPYIPQILSPEPTCEFEHYHAAKAFRAALAATEAAHA